MSTRVLTMGLVICAAASAQRVIPGRGPDSARFVSAEAFTPGPVVKGAPFSADAVTETTQVLPDGNRIRQANTVKMYRDAEGRTRRELSLNGIAVGTPANLPQIVFISDPVAGNTYALNLRDRSATKSATRSDGSPWGSGRPDFSNIAGRSTSTKGARPPVKTESLGRQLIDGIQAEGTRTTVTLPAGQIGNELPIQIVSESWFSPELKTVILSRRTDPRSGETSFRLTNITRAEPSRALFEVPADFKVTESVRGGRGRSSSPN